MECGGNSPHLVDPRSAENHIVGRGAVEHDEGDMEVNSGRVDWESDIPQCEFIFVIKPNEDYGSTMNEGLIYVQLL